MGGLIGGLVIGLAFLKYENHPKIRWTIRLFLLGVGAALISNESSTLGGLIAVLIFFPLAFGFIGVVIDLVKNSTNKEVMETSITEHASNNLNSSKVENKRESQKTISAETDFKKIEVQAKTDDDFWEDALNEFESENRKKGLYAKLYSLHTGDEAKIKSAYMQERHLQIKEEEEIKKQELEKKLEEQKKYQSAEESIREGNYKKQEYRKHEYLVFYSGQAAIKVSEKKYRLHEDSETVEASLQYMDKNGMYLTTGFLKVIEFDDASLAKIHNTSEKYLASKQYILVNINEIKCLVFPNGEAAIQTHEFKFRLYKNEKEMAKSANYFSINKEFLDDGFLRTFYTEKENNSVYVHPIF